MKKDLENYRRRNMQINHKSYKLDNGYVLIESCVIGSRIPGAVERYMYQRNKFIEESLLKSMSNEQLNELKQSVDTELATRNQISNLSKSEYERIWGV